MINHCLPTRSWITPAKAAGTPIINDEVFPQATFDFILIAFVIFAPVKHVNRFKKEPPSAPPAGPKNKETLLMDIRDVLKDRRYVPPLLREFPRGGREKTLTIDDPHTIQERKIIMQTFKTTILVASMAALTSCASWD